MTDRKYLCSAVLTLIFVVAGTAPALGENEVPLGEWQKEIKVGLNLLQSSYSNNWNGGEKGSVVWTGNLDARFENQFSEKSNWRNHLKLAYGQTHNQERGADGALNWSKPDKTDDIIDFESFYRRTLSSGLDPYLAFNFTSLFQDLTDVQGRELNFNPMSFKGSTGVSKKLIDTEKRKLMTRAGIALIQNYRKFFPGDLPSTETQSETSIEVAAEWITEYRTLTLNDRVDWESKLSFILPMSYTGKSVFEDGFISVGELPEDVASYTTT